MGRFRRLERSAQEINAGVTFRVLVLESVDWEAMESVVNMVLGQYERELGATFFDGEPVPRGYFTRTIPVAPRFVQIASKVWAALVGSRAVR